MSTSDSDPIQLQRPFADHRRLASELSLIHFLVKHGDYDFERASAQRRPAESFATPEAAHIVGRFLRWYVDNPGYGLIGRTISAETADKLRGLSELIVDYSLSTGDEGQEAPSGTVWSKRMGADYELADSDDRILRQAQHIADDMFDLNPAGIYEAIQIGGATAAVVAKLAQVVGD